VVTEAGRNALPAPVAVPASAPTVAEAASLMVVIVILPVVSSTEACRLLATRAALSSVSVSTSSAAVPNVMVDAVPPPVAAIVRTSPAQALRRAGWLPFHRRSRRW